MAIKFTAKTETELKSAAAAVKEKPAETKAAEKPAKTKAKKVAKTDAADDDTLL